MNKYISYSILAFLMLLLASCQKDAETFIPDESNVNVDIFGIVVDENDEPIEGAQVDLNGKIEITDVYGIYKYSDARITDRHNFLNIKKSGYFEGVRTFRSNKNGSIQLKTKLIAKNFNQTFDSTSGGTISTNVVEINFSPNSIMIDDTGEPYNGVVQVALEYIDPTKEDVVETMPGDLSALDAQGAYSVLTSYGMMLVELSSPDGKDLQILTGQTVEMIAEIPSSLGSLAPNEIPMWYFNYAIGLWEEEGVAIKAGNKYIGNVTHFSSWNYDLSDPAILLSGRVVDDLGNPIGNAYVSAHIINGGGGHGPTNDDGTFSGLAPKDEMLTLSITYGGVCFQTSPVYSKVIGPFLQDTDLGDIIIESGELDQLSVTGRFIDCAANPITDGFVKINSNQYYEIDNGTIDISLPTCNLENYYIEAIDRVSNKSSEIIPLVNGQNNDLGDVQICTFDVDFFSIENQALDYSVTIIDSLWLEKDREFKYIFAAFDDLDKSHYINFGFMDSSQAGVAEGTFEINEYEFRTSHDAGGTRVFLLSNGEITVTQGTEEHGGKVRGSFNMTVNDVEDNEQYVFTGSFQLTCY